MFVTKLNNQEVVNKLRITGRFNVTDNRRRLGRVRTGKTRRDHESGSWKQRFFNRDARNER